MATAIKAACEASKSTATGSIATLTAIPTLEIGKMMNKTAMGFIPSPTGHVTKAIFKQESSKVRESWSIKPEKKMI